MRTRVRPLRPLLLLCGALLGATLAPLPLGAQEAAAEADEPAAEAQKPGSEGVKVHGHWVIEVRNSDGSLAERRAFENGLTDSGGVSLATLLINETAGSWGVTFANSSNDGPCSGGPCGIAEEGSAVLDGVDGLSENLSVAFTPPGGIELSGSETVDHDGQIERVITWLGTCGASVTPQDCDASDISSFTSKTLADAISVTAGQSVSVTVIISFS